MDRVRRLYRQGAHSTVVLAALQRVEDWLSEEKQDAFVTDILGDEVVQKFPPQAGYPYSVLKRMYAAVEGERCGPSDALVSAVLELQPRGAANPCGDVSAVASFYRCFELGEARLVTPIRVWPEFSQVGLALWPAGYALAEWILSHAREFRQARVVELGSGVGLTGVVLSKCTDAASALLTDYLPTVNQNAEQTLAECGAERASVAELDWEKVRSGDEAALKVIEDSDATHLLAADVIYDHDVIPALADTVRAFLRLCPGLEHVVVAVTHRSEESWGLMLAELKRNELELDLVASAADGAPAPEDEVFFYERGLIKIYRLRSTREVPRER
eukprot:TRINITY_DN44432_c0_g1_i1.p1 TRINITY_DN44432_c0_g1~~TRINITY_DN44432_c0_g1_i1.p1  ORF type:complete len:330 (+),score=94.78 TRINITY_DN44432_c0_g1_i1:71-1060(+)